jgi:hypothetical protein
LSTKKKEKKTDKKISPEEYRDIINSIELLNIRLTSADVKFKVYEPPMGYNISSKETYEQEADSNVVTINQIYTLAAKPPKSRKNGITIKCCYEVTFKSDRQLTGDFFEIYSHRSLPLNTWPYFREFVNSMTARMDLPPLTLPLFKTA